MNNYYNFYEYVAKYHLGEIIKDACLKDYCTLKIGGKCLCVYKPNSVHSLIKAYKYIVRNKLDYYVLGNGSNMLISDEYHSSVIINLKNLSNYNIVDNLLTVQAGVMGNVLSKKISKQNLSGLEFLSGIPGTIGGMVYMNAGAWNHHISDIIESITYLDEFGKICVMEKICDKGFGYRKSPFMKRHVIILSCTIKLTNDDNAFNRYLEYLTKKIASQPLKSYNAGCTFKNPLNQSAWKLIREHANNLQFNNIEISNIHANFLINKSNATFNEMIEAINLIQENVYQNTNISLELELTILR